MQPFTVAYAAAMKNVASQYPTDDDVQVLAAEAAVDVNPWKLWSAEGKPTKAEFEKAWAEADVKLASSAF